MADRRYGTVVGWGLPAVRSAADCEPACAQAGQWRRWSRVPGTSRQRAGHAGSGGRPRIVGVRGALHLWMYLRRKMWTYRTLKDKLRDPRICGLRSRR
jgi:hypothetical protein